MLNTTPEYVLYEMSYENLILFSHAVPVYDDEKEEEWDDSIDANNPDNFNDDHYDDEYV